MHLSLTLLTLATVLSLSSCLTFRKSPTFESVFDTGPWVQGERPDPSTTLHLQIVLKQSQVQEFEERVMNISTPGHELHGKHLTREQVQEFLRPSNESIEIVLAWLRNTGIEKYYLRDFADRVDVEINVTAAETILDADFHVYTMDDQSSIRSMSYSLPLKLHEHVTTIMPIVRFPQTTTHMSTILTVNDIGLTPTSMEYDLEFCNKTMTPACLQGLYQMDYFRAPPDTGTMLGVSGFFNHTLLTKDLHDFIAAYAPYAPQVFPQEFTTDNTDLFNPDFARAEDTLESSLDMQYAGATAPGIPLTYYKSYGLAIAYADQDSPVAGKIMNEPYENLLDYLLKLPDDELPSVLSTSFGENEQTVVDSYNQIICNMLGQLTARGVSLIFSSGDSGPGSSCASNKIRSPTFNPIFPASCPFVTSVGGTTGINPERAAPFSGGGFSAYWRRPSYQDTAVNAYLDILGDQWKDLFTRGGRAFPDVAIQSTNFLIRDHKVNKWISGTSAAAPVFAAMIANLNAARLSQGLPKLGFLNPWLYANAAEIFTDITEGGSRGCTGTSMYSGANATFIPYASWNATKGWDPVTGLGTPIWPKLLEVALRRDPIDHDLEFSGGSAAESEADGLRELGNGGTI